MVFVDELRVWGEWKYGESCHMLPASQSEADLEELHAFALRVGMKRDWFQPGRWPHYDLTRRRRAVALRLGAQEVDTKAYIRALRELGRYDPPTQGAESAAQEALF